MRHHPPRSNLFEKIMELWQLQQMRALPLEAKIVKTQLRIREWYEHWDGNVYVSFSGGKDCSSTHVSGDCQFRQSKHIRASASCPSHSASRSLCV